MRLLKIGELAKKAGVTVKTLHHYDRIGLLPVTVGRESGCRLYGEKDVQRLQHILSLKSMGLSLEAIGKCLDDEEHSLHTTLLVQEASISANIENLKKIQSTLRLMMDRISNQSLSTDDLLKFMKELQTMEKYYTADQVKKLKARYEKFPDKVKEVEEAWPKLFKKFEEAMHKGLPVNDLKVQVLAKEAELYIDLFTGGDKEIAASLEKFSSEQRESALKVWNVSREVFDYADRARKNLKSY